MLPAFCSDNEVRMKPRQPGFQSRLPEKQANSNELAFFQSWIVRHRVPSILYVEFLMCEHYSASPRQLFQDPGRFCVCVTHMCIKERERLEKLMARLFHSRLCLEHKLFLNFTCCLITIHFAEVPLSYCHISALL